jgi:hypothetical protein
MLALLERLNKRLGGCRQDGVNRRLAKYPPAEQAGESRRQ